MKEKGFTLIELLAVIVILAVIALIATPLVLKYIEKSRKESKVDSVYSFVRNLETEIANYSIKNKGTKYNGQPNDKGYFEISNFENPKIDIKVKGDNPDTIKVCLSSLGQVEKAMFEYGKYYVSYDGKKGSISDKDTYDNFSCSGKGSGNYLFDEDTVNFSYNSEAGGYVGIYSFGDQEIPNFQFARTYNLIINNGDSILVTYVNGTFINESDDTVAVIQDGVLTVLSSVQLDGNKNVKIGYSSQDYIPYMVRIHNTGKWYLYSIDGFVVGNAEVKITDNEGTVYYDADDVTFTQESMFIGTDGPNREVLGDIPEVYTALTNGKTITITVTQEVDGKAVVTTIGGTAPKLLDDSAYYWGNPLFEESFT